MQSRIPMRIECQADQMEAFESCLDGEFTPEVGHTIGIREEVWLVEHQDRLVLNPEIAPVGKSARKEIKMPAVVIHPRISLLNEDLLVQAMPYPRPSLICPCKAKWKVRLPGLKNFLERLFEQPPAAKPVVPIAKRLYP